MACAHYYYICRLETRAASSTVAHVERFLPLTPINATVEKKANRAERRTCPHMIHKHFHVCIKWLNCRKFVDSYQSEK